jgi:hypothetical protein
VTLKSQHFSDLWRTPGLERQMNRERLLLKANQATYDPANQADPASTQSRQPTDLWSGFGFSNSLPADLLKPRLKHDFWNDDPNVPVSVAAGFKPEVGFVLFCGFLKHFSTFYFIFSCKHSAF